MNQQKLEQGDIVWAKLGRFPWWPALVKQLLNEDEIEVEYLGDLTRSYLPLNKVQRFDNMSIPEKPSKALQQSIQNAYEILKGRLTRDELFMQLTNIPTKTKTKKKKKILKNSAKKKIKKIKTIKKNQRIKKIESDDHEISIPITELEFAKKLSTSIKVIDIKQIEKEFQNFIDDLNDNNKYDNDIVNKLIGYEQNLEYFNTIDIYQSNIGILIDNIIKILDQKKMQNIKDKFDQLKESISKIILIGFYKDKEYSKVYSTFSDAQTDFPQLGPKEDNNRNQDQQNDQRIYFRVQKKISKVLYLSQGKLNQNFQKYICEECARFVEQIVRNKINNEQYKQSILKILNKLQKNPKIIKKILQQYDQKDYEQLKETIENCINQFTQILILNYFLLQTVKNIIEVNEQISPNILNQLPYCHLFKNQFIFSQSYQFLDYQLSFIKPNVIGILNHENTKGIIRYFQCVFLNIKYTNELVNIILIQLLIQSFLFTSKYNQIYSLRGYIFFNIGIVYIFKAQLQPA